LKLNKTVVGVTWNFHDNIPRIKMNSHMSKSIETYNNTFWMVEGATKILTGILAYKFRNNINEYV